MHIPQNILAETELRHLAAIPYQMISPGNNKPIIAVFQDSLLGSYRFTRPDIHFTPRQAMSLLMSVPRVNTDDLRKAGTTLTSFDILSQITPPMTLKTKTSIFNDKRDDPATTNNIVEIRNGKYVRGQLEKSTFESATKGILHRIHNDFGSMRCVNYLDDLQSIITEYMKISSFSVGISDLIADRATQDQIANIILEKKMEVQTIIDKVHLGIFENNSAKTNMVEFESKVNNTLNEATNDTGKIGRDSLSKDNRFLMIVESGSKGSLINISQMISCLGQQNVDGKRISYGFDHRTLPHYKKFDDSPNARGFIENSYITGLTAPELFFHAMAGRIGLIDTAVKSVTRETTIVILEDGEPKYTAIGDWIDARLEEGKDRVQHFPEDRRLEMLELAPQSVYIPTTDYDGNVTWGELTAVTRHDPGRKLYEMETRGGKKVTVPESKSLLVWRSEGFQEVETKDIAIGDCMPSTARLCAPPVVKHELDELLLDYEMGVFTGILLLADQERHNEVPEYVREVLYNHMGGAAPYHVPDVAFVADDDFVRGVVSGFFACDASIVTETGIEAHGTSARVIEGIAMLCTRLGFFVQMDGTTLRIEGPWLADFMCILDPASQMGDIPESHPHFRSHHDVVLDPIVSIREVGVEAHPKLYDVTVPSTLNFGLANGLQVRDTSQTGYIQRRLVKGLEDLKVDYDMTVRNNKGKVIQFAYGDDHFESIKVENQTLPLVGMTVEDIYMHYDLPGMSDAERNVKLSIFTKGTVTRMNKQKEACMKRCREYTAKMIEARDQIVKHVFKYKNDSGVRMPIAFQYIIGNLQGQLDLKTNSAVDITPLEAFDLIESYYQKLNAIPCVKTNPLFEIMYYYYLSPRDLLVQRRFHHKGLLLLLETVLLRFKEAIIHPGEMVGVLGAQSIGEPSTQLTLNTFHNTGVSSKSNVTRGVPRIEEILRLTKNPKNPSLTVFLKPLDETSKDTAVKYATMIEHTRLGDLVSSVQICFEPRERMSRIADDQGLLDQFYAFEQIVEDCIGSGAAEATASAASSASADDTKSKWIIRMEMDPDVLVDKNITMDDIHFALSHSGYGKDLDCVFADYNHDKLVFRLRTKGDALKVSSKRKPGVANPLDQSDEIYLLRNFQDMLLNNIVLRGIHGIKNVLPQKLQNTLVKEDGKYVRKDTWALDTTGTNLLSALALDYIDATRTYSNDIREVFDVLGIEAARQSIHNELLEVMEFSGVYINYHHTSLLCDRMTCNKGMVSIYRSGLLSDNVGPIAKASFEVHTEVLLNAARHGEFDHMRGVSANIMCGQHGCYGTNAFGLVLDTQAFASVEDVGLPAPEPSLEVSEDPKSLCSRKQIEIHNNIASMPKTVVQDMCDDGYEVGF